MLASAVYEGVVRHRRHIPRMHAFNYRMAQIYLDLDEIDAALGDRWLWSVNRPNLAEWRRSDYLGPGHLSLADAVRLRVRAETGREALGPIRVLTHARYVGYIFNPVSFYYCYGPDGTTLDFVVAEITNTPWKERHSYVLPVAASQCRGRRFTWKFDKSFHVSPFVAMDRGYQWSFTTPGRDLHVHMGVSKGQQLEFDATLALKRRALDSRSLARVLWRYPLMTLQVIGAIHWEALRIWLKRTPVYEHPPVHDMETEHE